MNEVECDWMNNHAEVLPCHLVWCPSTWNPEQIPAYHRLWIMLWTSRVRIKIYVWINPTYNGVLLGSFLYFIIHLGLRNKEFVAVNIKCLIFNLCDVHVQFTYWYNSRNGILVPVVFSPELKIVNNHFTLRDSMVCIKLKYYILKIRNTLVYKEKKTELFY